MLFILPSPPYPWDYSRYGPRLHGSPNHLARSCSPLAEKGFVLVQPVIADFRSQGPGHLPRDPQTGKPHRERVGFLHAEEGDHLLRVELAGQDVGLLLGQNTIASRPRSCPTATLAATNSLETNSAVWSS